MCATCPSSTSLAIPCGECASCGGTLYANLTHQCRTSVKVDGRWMNAGIDAQRVFPTLAQG